MRPPAEPVASTIEGGREVAGFYVNAVLEVASRHGVARASLIDGLAVDELDRRGGRIGWDAYTVILDRMEAAVGGMAGVEAIASEMMQSSRFLATLASQMLTVERLLRFGLCRVGAATCANVSMRMDTLPGRKLHYEYTIAARYRGSLPYGYATLASIRSYGRLLGQPPLLVDAQIGTHRAVFHCTLPPDDTLAARAARAMREHIGSLLPGGTAGSEGSREPALLEHDVPEDFVDTAQAEAVTEIGQRLCTIEDLQTIEREVAAFARGRFCAEHVVLWVRRSPGAPLSPVSPARAGGPPSHTRAVRPLLIGARDVGRLELDFDGEAWPRQLELILPWLALAVDRGVQTGAAARPATPTERAAARWRLTRREGAVLDLLVGGLANKEIATALGCGVKNVEAALTQVLRKAGVGSRTALVGAVWGSTGEPQRGR